MRAAPLALGGLLQLRVQADQVVGPRAGVAQDDLAALLAHLAVVLVVRLVAVTIVDWGGAEVAMRAVSPCPRPAQSPPEAALAHGYLIDVG